jgi:hypothetical protein
MAAFLPIAMTAAGALGGLSSAMNSTGPMDQYQQLLSMINRMMGPGALASATQDLYQQMNSSPMAASMRADSAMGARATQQGLAGQQGISGMSSTGVGGLQRALGQSLVSNRNQAVSADIFRQASASAAQNMGQRMGLMSFSGQGINMNRNQVDFPTLFSGMMQGGLAGIQSNQQANQFQQMLQQMGQAGSQRTPQGQAPGMNPAMMQQLSKLFMGMGV